jgi:hypothetical protein
MSKGIFLIDENGGLVRLDQAEYDSESVLQEMLAKYPELIPGDQINSISPRRWLLIDREMGIPDEEAGSRRWSLDHLLIDQDAIPTLIEIKRSTDTRIRREVVGQLLEYAANAVVFWPMEELKSILELNCRDNGQDIDQVLSDFLEDSSDNIDQFWEKLRTNLQIGKVRLLFVADSIPKELKRIVEFLNEQMSPAEVLAVEIPQFVGEGLKTLTPRIVGQTSKAEIKKPGGSPERQWDEQSFFEEIANRNGEEVRKVANEIYEWITLKVTKIWWGKGKRSGSYVPVLEIDSVGHVPFSVWTYGTIEINFQHYLNKPVFKEEERRVELMSKLNLISGVDIKKEQITKRPNIKLEWLIPEGNLDLFFDAYQWYIDKITEK